MNGLELSRGFWEECGKPMLEADFSDLLPFLAVGFVGSGSEHYGFDDEVSRDHDFEPGFCIFLPDETVIDRKQEFRLERAYAKLPKEYHGFRRLPVSPVGGNRHGVIRTADFYNRMVGTPDGELSVSQWLSIPDYALAEAVNGAVFWDLYGEFTAIRQKIVRMPEDIRKKRIAGNLLLMAQSGPYNFVRCLRHGESEAAQLACGEFVTASLRVIFLLKNRYLPYYKWSFRALRQLDGTEELSEYLSFLLSADHGNDATAVKKTEIIEKTASLVLSILLKRYPMENRGAELEAYAYAVNDRISDGNLRNMNIFSAIP